MLNTEERVDRLEVLVEENARQLRQIEMALLRLERAIQETNARTEKDRRELARQLGDVANRLGTIVEDIIAPSLRRLARAELDCGELQSFAVRLEKYHPTTGQRREFDVMAVGRKAILLNQTKAHARSEYAKEFAEFLQSGEFFQYFPEYTGKPLIPVFSSLQLSEEIVAYLTRQGIYAVGMGDETMQVLNLEQLAAGRPS